MIFKYFDRKSSGSAAKSETMARTTQTYNQKI